MAMIAVNDTCECFIEVHWSDDDKISKIRMIYCPMHSAANTMCEVLADIYTWLQTDQGGNRNLAYKPSWVDAMLKARALASGEEGNDEEE